MKFTGRKYMGPEGFFEELPPEALIAPCVNESLIPDWRRSVPVEVRIDPLVSDSDPYP